MISGDRSRQPAGRAPTRPSTDGRPRRGAGAHPSAASASRPPRSRSAPRTAPPCPRAAGARSVRTASGSVRRVSRECQPVERTLTLRLAQLPAAQSPVERRNDTGPARRQRFRVTLGDLDVQPGPGTDLRDARPRQAATHDADPAEFTPAWMSSLAAARAGDARVVRLLGDRLTANRRARPGRRVRGGAPRSPGRRR